MCYSSSSVPPPSSPVDSEKGTGQLCADKESSGDIRQQHDSVRKRVRPQYPRLSCDHYSADTCSSASPFSSVSTAADSDASDRQAHTVDEAQALTQTQLMLACQAGDGASVQDLLQRGDAITEVLATDRRGWTALWYAVRCGHKHCVHLLLEHCPEEQVLGTSRSGILPLMIAAEEGRVDCMRELLAHVPHMQLSARDFRGRTALMRAAEQGHESALNAILEGADGSDPYFLPDADGNTALHAAVEGGDAACVRRILGFEHLVKSTASAKNGKGLTPLALASRIGHASICKLLMDNYGEDLCRHVLMESNAWGETALIKAAECGHGTCVRLLLLKLPVEQVMTATRNGWTALMRAMRNGHPDVVRLLLQHAPERQVTAVNSAGRSALMVALDSPKRCSLECVRLLLRYSPQQQVLLSDRRGCTPLMLCAKYGHEACCMRLLFYRPALQVAMEDEDRKSALEHSVDRGHKDLIPLLLSAGARVSRLSGPAAAFVKLVVREMAEELGDTESPLASPFSFSDDRDICASPMAVVNMRISFSD